MQWVQELLLTKWSSAYLAIKKNEGKELTFLKCPMPNTLETFSMG